MEMTLVDEPKDICPPVVKPMAGNNSAIFTKKQHIDMCKDFGITPNWMWGDDDIVLFSGDGTRKVL